MSNTIILCILSVISPGVDRWISGTAYCCPKGHNPKKVPGLGIVKIGRRFPAFYDVPHVQGATRITLEIKI